MKIRVRLIKEITGKLPYGSLGTVLEGKPEGPGMSMVRWDKNHWEIPMWNSEIEVVK